MADLPDNFAEYPASLAECRADRSSSARDWTPRDVLIDLLRLIDRGELPGIDCLIVMYTGDGGRKLGYRIASPSYMQTLGTMALAKRKIVRESETD